MVENLRGNCGRIADLLSSAVSEKRPDTLPLNLVASLACGIAFYDREQILIGIASGITLAHLFPNEISFDKALFVQRQPELLRFMAEQDGQKFRKANQVCHAFMAVPAR